MELFKVGGFCPETNYLFMGKTLRFGRRRSTLTYPCRHPFNRRLRGPRLLFRWNISPSTCPESPLSWTDYPHSWQPRVSTNYTSLRILWRMSTQIWEYQCLEVVLRSFWLSSSRRYRRWPCILYPWRVEPEPAGNRPGMSSFFQLSLRKFGDFASFRSAVLTENKKFRMTDQCATCFGLILMVRSPFRAAWRRAS